jgi:hypothetical protein
MAKSKAAASGKSPTGWRKLALFNLVWLSLATLILVGFFMASSSYAGGITTSFIFYTGECDSSATRLNAGLHLLLNIFSTAVLASSNFFMQIMNAPSRKEIDRVHAKGTFLDIGVPSWRNTYYVSKFKTGAWALLLLSSVPIHLLFNSAVFATDRREANFRLTIATEGFTTGAPYFIPGASLSGAGLPDFRLTYGIDKGYGSSESLYSYKALSSKEVSNITRTAAVAASWKRLDARACADEYVGCYGLRKYRDLVIVVDPSVIWTRSKVWDLDANATKFWSDFGVRDQDNSLWFSTQCSMKSVPVSSGYMSCYNNCFRAVGAQDSHGVFGPQSGPLSSWTISFFNAVILYAKNYKTQKLEPAWTTWLYSSVANESEFGVRPGMDQLPISYCFAEPIETQCGVGLSNVLLFAVMICVLCKTMVCIFSFIALGKEHQLVTLGDAIASFVLYPDEGNPTSDFLVREGVTKEFYYTDEPIGPKQWRQTKWRAFSAIPRRAWWSNGISLGLPFTCGAVFLGVVSGVYKMEM